MHVTTQMHNCLTLPLFWMIIVYLFHFYEWRHIGASEHELSIQKMFLQSYYSNKKKNLVDRVESMERYETLKREAFDDEVSLAHVYSHTTYSLTYLHTPSNLLCTRYIYVYIYIYIYIWITRKPPNLHKSLQQMKN